MNIGKTFMFLSLLVLVLCASACIDSSSEPFSRLSYEEVKSQFKNPPRESSVNCWWWWMNSYIDKATITRDLEAMKDKGFEGAMIFDAGGDTNFGAGPNDPRGPLYGSPEWIELFVHALNEAERLGLHLGLNIQSGWNLGGPRVTPEYAAKKITFSEKRICAGDSTSFMLEKPKTHRDYYQDLWVLAFPVDKEKMLEKGIYSLDFKALTREAGGSAPDCSWMLKNEPRDKRHFNEVASSMIVDENKIIDLTSQMTADGTLTWNVPEGEWVVLRVGYTNTHANVSTSSPGWKGPVLDYMSVEAFDFYWNDVVEPILAASGTHPGKTLVALETDSWECDGMTWTKGFEQEFKDYCGYDLKNLLPIFAGYVVNDIDYSHNFLSDFRKTLGHLVSKNHYAQFAKHAHAYGIGIQPESAGPHAGPLDGIKNYGNSDIVMSEFWADSPHRYSPDSRFFVKQASSAAHIYGKKLVGAESFTRLGPHWNDILWYHQKPSFDHEICSGLNKVYFHTFTASPEREGLPGLEYFAGSHVNCNITYWKYFDAYVDYFHRVQNVVQNGKFVADILYYYGDHVPNILPFKDKDPAGALPGYDFDVTNEDILLQLTVKDGKIVVPSGIEYKLLVLPDFKTLSFAALKKVESLLSQGATVLGNKPVYLASLVGGKEAQVEFKAMADRIWSNEPSESGSLQYKRGTIAWGISAKDYLMAHDVPQDLNIQGNKKMRLNEFDFIHYDVDGRDVYFVCNLKPERKDIVCEFRVTGRFPELWDAMTGEMKPAMAFTQKENITTLPLRLEPHGSILVVFDKKISKDQNGTSSSNWNNYTKAQTLDGSWVVNFDPKWGGPETITFDSLQNWTTHPNEGVRYYSGTAVYNKTFDLKFEQEKGTSYYLELGSVKDVGIASARLNGVDLGIVWTPPFRLDISEALKAGKNTLEVTVINSWYNRVVADQVLGLEKPFTKTNIKLGVWRFAPAEIRGTVKDLARDLEPSGLIGPVTIQKVKLEK